MARVVLVHGILQTYKGADVEAAEWVPALLSGVRLAGGAGLLSADDIEAVFYGDLFRPPGRYLGDDDVETLDASDVPGDGETELLLEWWRAAAAVDPAVIPPDTRSLGAAASVQAALAALAGSRLLAGASERLLIWLLRQVRAYFTDIEVRAAVRRRLAEVIGTDTEVVVAHSLGSVVAYEGLCANPAWPVRGLVTLGSPLGIRNVIFDRLIPAPSRVGDAWRATWPGGVRSWTNVADRLDFVALVKRLAPRFGGITDVEINNGWKFHDVTRYLTAKETGAGIMAGLGR
ncbi:hypothetical protein [Dactylosporangium sp. CA-233914]|uniref:hypothetical protein n=1 Tax=Dactylosporangium sp. CA-233914 TaxID=3239934 RepID=UPI003D9222A8